MQAWGSACPGEIRNTEDRPTKSGLMGLVSACMGLDFNQVEKLDNLIENLNFSCRIDKAGSLLEDFQMVNYESRERHEKFPSGILSFRNYLVESLFTICLWGKDSTNIQLEDIADSLKHSIFTPYLGRSNCPPSLPFSPKIVRAPDLRSAFSLYVADPGHMIQEKRSLPHPQVFWEGPDDSIPVIQDHLRYDIPKVRKSRTFVRRLEHEGRL